jgi:hypothetical protein
MGLLSRLLVILLLCLAAIVLPPAPAQAQEGASITLSPASGVPGEEVTVYGYNFTPSTTGNPVYVDIYFDVNGDGKWTEDERRVYATTGSNGSFTAEFTVPESYKGPHKVFAVEYGTTLVRAVSAEFTVTPGLTITPANGAVGTNVTVTGMGFAKQEQGIDLYFDGEMVAENVQNADQYGSWTAVLQIPPSARGSHRIGAGGATTRRKDVTDATFDVTPGITLDKLSGSPGETVIVTGDGFYAARDRDVKVLFDGQQMATTPGRVDADDRGHWQASFIVPEKPKGTYSVTADGEITKKQDLTALSFQIGPGIVLAPTEGHVGTDLAVTGRGFAVSRSVDIYYEADKIGTETTDTKGSFQISFTVPESLHGARMVTARDSAGNNATAIFTMESDPPGTPELISPADGSRVGFVGNIRPTFEWTEVEDESGVYYSLQIARSANVTADGFAEALRSITRLVSNNCTLNATQALPYGTYYWMVRAVDRAGNAGNWTEMRSFRAGVMPLWGFILSVVGGVAVIGTLVYFYIIRRRIYYY